MSLAQYAVGPQPFLGGLNNVLPRTTRSGTGGGGVGGGGGGSSSRRRNYNSSSSTSGNNRRRRRRLSINRVEIAVVVGSVPGIMTSNPGHLTPLAPLEGRGGSK